jgi:hypothetical protein
VAIFSFLDKECKEVYVGKINFENISVEQSFG